ncbi:MAG: HAMP domain-containing protein [Ignavibacteriae bacterium]|nr:HAMP domain-containing protein [Ignavibacteriota bacterium]
MTLKTKLQVALLLVAALCIIFTGWQSFRFSRSTIEAITFARLTSIRETKKQQIESYFHRIRNQIVTLAEDRMTIDATKEFIRSAHTLDDLGSAEYAQSRARYHPVFQNFARRFGYNDILLADAEQGEIMYSVAGHSDFGTNLTSGPYSRCNIAAAFARANALTGKEAASLVDFAPYAPVGSLPAAFIASPVFDGAKRIGVLLFQMSIHEINSVMTSESKWEEEGLGKTGETYIVGADYTMRTDSRFFLQDSASYFKRLRQVGADSAVLARIRSRSTSILTQRAETDATRDALNGRTDTRMIDDYRGIPVLSSYTPLQIPDVQWVMLAEIDAHEALAPVFALRERLIFVGLILLLLAGAIGFLLSLTISRPLNALTAATEQFGKGDLFHRAAELSRDEIGVLARTFNTMADSMKDSTERLRTEITERRRAEEELRASREELRSLSTHLQSVREDERRGIAREIHDELGQALSTLKLDLALMKEDLHASPDEAEKRMSSMSQVCDTTIKSVKRIITELRPRLLDDLGLTAAIEWQAEDFQLRTGIACSLSITPEEIRLDAERSTAIFRIFQETLTNIARHSGATKIAIRLQLDDAGVTLRVSDNGKGISEQQIHDSRSFGLLGIRERTHYWGGTVVIKGAHTRGTTVSVFLPGTFPQERA